jgi:hypothetical protein
MFGRASHPLVSLSTGREALAGIVLALVWVLAAEEFANVARGAFIDASIGTAVAGDTLFGELGGESTGIRTWGERRFLMQWDVLGALEAGWLAYEHPFTFLVGPHALASLEVGARLLRDKSWSPYVGVGTSGDVSILANPGLSLSALDTTNSVDGIGGVVARGTLRISTGVSFIERHRSLLLYAIGQEALAAPEINTLGQTFTELGFGARYDVSQSIMTTVEGVWGLSPNRAGPLAHDQMMHLGLTGTFRKIFSNGMWIGASVLLERDTDHVTYPGGATFDTGTAPTFRFGLMYGLPLWRAPVRAKVKR